MFDHSRYRESRRGTDVIRNQTSGRIQHNLPFRHDRLRAEHLSSGRRATRRSRDEPRTMDLAELDRLLDRDPEDIVMKLAWLRSDLNALLLKTDDGFVEVLLRLLAKACKAKGNTTSLNQLMQQTNNSAFWTGGVVSYVTKCRLTSSVKYDVLLAICDILEACLERIPATCVDNVTSVMAQLQSLAPRESSNCSSEARQLAERLRILEQCQGAVLQQIKGGTLLKPLDLADSENAAEPPDLFRQIPIRPTAEDLCHDLEPFLRKIKINKSYRDVEEYLDIQFRLLREDYMFPLRQGIRELRRTGQEGIDHRYIQDVYVYSGVLLQGSWCSEKGIVYRYSFDTSGLKHVHWEYSKRLIYGSLVCLSADEFRTFVVGTVAEREPSLLREGFIDIRILEGQRVDMNSSTTYTMVESSAYFEAYRYNLEGLQELNVSTLPFRDYLLNQSTEPGRPPRYLRGTSATFDFKPLLKSSFAETGWNVLDETQWKNAVDFGMDQSQFKALQLAITHEFSLIQGPPGTGKTFIALKIVELLLHNFPVWGRRLRRVERGREEIGNNPILLVCYTNHALDQFLEGILKFTDADSGSVVRVGGRCNVDNELVRRCHLPELKRRDRFKIPEEIRETKWGILEQMKDVEQVLAYFTKERAKGLTAILPVKSLLPFMTPSHRQCFEMLMAGSKKQTVLTDWLLRPDNGTDNEELMEDEKWDEGAHGNDSHKEDDNNDEGSGHNNMDIEVEQMDDIDFIERNRMLNVDDADNGELRLGNVSKAVLNQSPTKYEQQANVNVSGQWEVVMSKKRLKHILRVELGRQDWLTEEEESMIWDIWQMSFRTRWKLYRLWRNRFDQDLAWRIVDVAALYNNLADRLVEVRNAEDYQVLRDARVIAMTTTGAAKYRHLLNRIQPSIVIVEEAAEVLEAHIITSLPESCQHLILIGDHQQLRPKPTVYKLAKKYHLDISLFERMTYNNVQRGYLETQHRMRPEIAKLIVPHIYPHLSNDKSVEEYDNIRGINGNVFFVRHQHAEMSTADTKSRKNIHEADYLTALCRYLIQQGYEDKDVTILTAYTGQMFEIKKRIQRDDLTRKVRVTPVDNFQGEENDIILLSLVRSNQEGKAGFLKIANRICVACSRARKGLYVIGDMELMKESSTVWRSILDELSSERKVVDGLPLFCQNHPDTGIHAITAEDFKKAPHGGCTRPCEFRLKCGHVCALFCHSFDPQHEEYECEKPCDKIVCEQNHRCTKKCFEECAKCEVLVEKTIPGCNHQELIPCWQDPSKHRCTRPCERTMQCGHKCPRPCGQECLNAEKCQQIVPGRRWPCGHELDVECYRNEDNYPCPVLVERRLPCGHRMEAKCSADIRNIQCKVSIDIVLCKRGCRNTITCFMKEIIREQGCQTMLQKVCKNNPQHVHSAKCCEYESTLCTCLCKARLPCGHQCKGQCGTCRASGEHKPCNEDCGRALPCQHKCRGRCGEPCSPCRETCERACPHGLCRKGCSEPCKCTAKCVRACQHGQCTNRCFEQCSYPPCDEHCQTRLNCGHRCLGYCAEPCVMICSECTLGYYQQVHRSLDIRMKKDDKYVTLSPCNHIIPADYMDKMAQDYLNEMRRQPRELRLFVCPICRRQITYCPRYQSAIIACREDMNRVKRAFLDADMAWRALTGSDLVRKLHDWASGRGLCPARRELMWSIGCVRILDEVERYLKRIKTSKEKGPYMKVETLEQSVKKAREELEREFDGFRSEEGDVKRLSFRVQLLFMQAVLTDLLTYVKSPWKRRDIYELLIETISQLEMDKSSIRRHISHVNSTLCRIIPIGLRKGIEDYEEEMKKYFQNDVCTFKEKKWIICEAGHAFPVKPETVIETVNHRCPVCTADSNELFAPDDRDDEEDRVHEEGRRRVRVWTALDVPPLGGYRN